MKINREDNGSALVIVLGMLAVLMLMAVAFSIIMRTERAGTTNLRHSLTAQNGINSAIALAIHDIEEDVGDEIIPDWENYVFSSFGLGTTKDLNNAKLSILNERAQRHLNPTTRALVKNATVDWRLLYSGIPLSNYSANSDDYLDDDTIVGRVAYVAVNTTGYIDPNKVTYLKDYDSKELTKEPIIAVPEDSPQFNDTSFAKNGGKNVLFSKSDFVTKRQEKNREGFTSFADLYTLNESEMYDSSGKLKKSPQMFINLFSPKEPNKLFLPDIFGSSASFGMSPYPPQVERDVNEPYADPNSDDYVVLREPVKIESEPRNVTLTEDVMRNIYVAFCNIFARKNWIEESSYGEGEIQYENNNEISIGNVEWPFRHMGVMKNSVLTRADLALLSFAEFYTYKRGNDSDFNSNKYIEMAIDVINDGGGRPKISDVLDAPCFKHVPMVSSIIGYTDNPEVPDDNDIKIYYHNGNGKFSPVKDDDVIPPKKTTAKYYAKYELPINFVVSATSPYLYKGGGSPTAAKMNVKIMFGPNANGQNIFADIQKNINGDPKIVIDPQSNFAKKVKGGHDFSESEKYNKSLVTRSIKAEDDSLTEKIEIYIQCKDPSRISTEEAPIAIKDIKNLFRWEDAQFDKSSLDKYSIDIFAQIDIKVGSKDVQLVPGKKIRSKSGPEGYIHFKLPLFFGEVKGNNGNNGNKGNKEINHHRFGYAMVIDPRFAAATYCLNEFREESTVESFPFWVNNAMAENLGEFSKLKEFEMDAKSIDDLVPGGRTPDIANPYGKLVMGFNAEGDGVEDHSFWENIIKLGDFSKEQGIPCPDTLHKIPGGVQLVNDSGFVGKDLEIDFGIYGSDISSLGELGSLCIGPWETISLYRTQTLNKRNNSSQYDFHTVFDFFTLDIPSKLSDNKVNLNTPPLVKINGKKNVQIVKEGDTEFGGQKLRLSRQNEIRAEKYVSLARGMNLEPLTAVICSLDTNFDDKSNKSTEWLPLFNYEEAQEIASRIIYQNTGDGNCYYFKDISQIGYSYTRDSLLNYVIGKMGDDALRDSWRENLLGSIAKYVTTRGQTFTIVVRSDAFAPKYGSDVDGTTLASKVAVVEAWRDTEPARDKDGNPITIPVYNSQGRQTGEKKYHNWHIRSVRIVD
ncbi:MAG: hypothetical protein J6V41_00520 [Kiritimatiellae bacterium]|nr:hypothetical protein [Kiritimatiellia bacterium]